MVHLTNDYRKLLSKNGPKAALSLCVALALSGGLVSAEEKTYDDVSPWGSREALEGDPIEVEWMRGGEGTLRAGTDETGNVLIHHLKTWGNPDTYAYVKGKKITIEDRDPSDPTANWGGKMYIGGDTTESVTMKGLHAGNQSETTIYGRTISMGTLGTGNGQFTIGNKNTESVTINDFGAAEGSSTIINGHSVSMGSLNDYKGKVTVNADGNFKVGKDTGLQHIGVVGGQLTVYAGSMEAKSLSAAGGNSMADIHISGEKGVHFLNGLSATEGGGVGGGTIRIDSPVITIDAADGYNGITASNHSEVILQGKDLFVESGLGITDSSLNASETGTIQLGKKNADKYHRADFRFTGSHISLGSETSSTNIYGNIITYGYQNNSSLAIHGKDILIAGVGDGEIGDLQDAISTNGDIVTVGDDSSNVEMQGRLCNTGSSVTVNGQKIRIRSPHTVNAGSDMQDALHATGNANTTTAIGNEKTDSVIIDGLTWVDNGSLSMHGKNIQLSRPKGIALSGSQDAKILIGGNETGDVTISGQVFNLSANVMKLSGKHITIDSTQYDGSEESFFSQSLVTGAKGIDAGDENTKTISISGGLRAGAGDINVKGRNITIGASHYFNTHKIRDDLQDGFIANAANGKVNIGSEESELVHLYDGQLLAGGADINILGKNISVASSANYITPDKDGSVNMIHAKGGNVSIGNENSDIVALSGGRLLADGEDITVNGHHISLDGKQQWAGQTNGGNLTIGSQNSDSVSIQGKGGIYALGGKTYIKGKRISIHSDAQNALENAGAPINVGDSDTQNVGDSDTQSVDISGGIVSHGSNISIMGRDISISKGKQENAIYTDGGTVSIKATGGDTAHISGPIRNEYGNIDISLTGRPNHLDSQIITTMYGTRTKLTLSDKASWSPQGEATYAISDTAGEQSNLTSYVGNDGILYLDNQTKQTITVRQFDDNGSRIHEDIYGSKNTGNDAIHIDESYKGNTHFWLVNRDDTDKGVVGTILASAGNRNEGSPATRVNRILAASALNSAESTSTPNISQFTADHFVAYGMSHLFFKTYGLATQKSSVQKVNLMFANQSSDPNAPDNPHNNQDFTAISNQYYDQDLIITGVTNHTTNEHGQYTPTVSTALSGSSLMYYTWRTENDKMLQRVGDLRENEGEETGLWARIRGSRIGKSHSDRGFKNQYKVYEIGYDAKTEDNDRMKSFTGIAFSYLDGKGYYTDGRGTNQAASAAIYHTDIHKTGHYLDLVFRIRHMNERLHTHTTVDTDIGPITEDHSASMDTTGLSFSAEYGRKKFVGNGWYVEPQTQWTLGYLGPNQYEMDNGTRVEQPGITSFVGRVGFNLGRQVNPNSIVYLKANVYHEFGGHSPIHLYAGDESLSFTDTFDDTWFEYGVGFAMKLGSRLSLYGDFEKSAGSHFYKDWQWNAGIRYSF